MKEKLESYIEDGLTSLGFEADFIIEHPENISFGDYSTNAALILAKKTGENPLHFAEKIASVLNRSLPEYLSKVSVAAPGFINFWLSDSFFDEALEQILANKKYGAGESLSRRKIIVEYTDPNPFKEFHIGHLMSNTIGESISRLVEWNGAEVKRACYQGDVGLHVAYAVAEKLRSKREWTEASDVAKSYSGGSKLYEEDGDFKNFVLEVNKKIYNKTDTEVNEVYGLGRQLTLDYFERIYRKLGTKFDYYFFESTTGEFGKALVHENIEFFEKSEGAIVFRGEKYDPKLHTRVFINKEGLPTYEAKELGLARIKFDTFPYDRSIVITGNEVNDYFKVVLKAMSQIFPKLSEVTDHISHGMLRLPSGKMSSRTGDVITAESLISEVKEKVKKKVKESEKVIEDIEDLSEKIAIGAIKYSILKQSPGKDIVFDFDKSLSFEGDSGPYLQYTHARINSVLLKAETENIAPSRKGSKVFDIERFIYRFPEVVLSAQKDFAPHQLIKYLVEISASFNHFYAENQIVSKGDIDSPKKIALSAAVQSILKNGLNMLGIESPDRM